MIQLYYLDDKVRRSYVLEALKGGVKLFKRFNIQKLKENTLNEDNIIVYNRGSYLDYYEFFDRRAWFNLKNLKENENIHRQDILTNFVKIKFMNILQSIHKNYKIYEWNYINSVLNIKIKRIDPKKSLKHKKKVKKQTKIGVVH
jgi:hypothetical protein